MGKNSSVISSSSWTLGVKFIERGVSLAVYIMLARFLSVEEFGVVAFAMLFLEFITVFTSSGVKDFILTRKEISSSFIDTCTYSVVFISIAISSIFYLVMDVFFIDKSETMKDVFKVLLFLPAISSFNIVQTALLQRSYNFKNLSLRNLISTIIAGVVSLYCAYNDYGAWALVLYQYCKVMIDTVILQILVKYRPNFHFSTQHFKECYKFSLPLLFSEIMNFWSTRMMDFFVSVIHGAASLAILNIARKFSRLVQQLSLTSLRPVVLSYASKSENKSQSFAKFIAYVTFTIAPVLIAIGVYAEFYVTPIFGAQWAPAVTIIELLSYTAIAQCLSWYFGLILIAQSKNILLFKLNVIFTLTFFIVGVGSYKLSFENYVAVQVVLINIISFYKVFFVVKKKYIEFKCFMEFILPAVFSCLIFVVFALVFREVITNNLNSLSFITVSSVVLSSVISFLISAAVTMLFFKSFRAEIINIFLQVSLKFRKSN
ncbi:oligosaccharide flippase family protein [Alteromonas mediterranea]|uniref:oligosaccharide flippase family protein n=1 Tax=Alteromonas mediterranea TaxID=314275 RepID=UPI00035559A6|nr:oligosaccharide flippase family protein [Alteromonas mediterranea]AGP85308.1 polysaccharide transport protein [Alteromonas mediterranea U4]AGP89430.1 polysaccharide transport protein [Alteromonas mediterranea U7]AGP93303.1 polysaccharide transport protein [Alteromonas mediterranea U8]